MSAGSLKLRLLLVAAIAVTLALLAAGLALATLFENQVRSRVEQELDNDILQLAGAAEVMPDGSIKITSDPADPRFYTPLSGKYWTVRQVQPGGQSREVARSRSLWDAGVGEIEKGLGPDGERLIYSSRQITMASPKGDVTLDLFAAVHDEEINAPLRQFRTQIATYLSLISLALIIAAWLQVSIGLRPLEVLRRQLANLRAHGTQKVEGEYPTEVQPLVTELNEVLELRNKSLERARHRAGDLAHGLMTPLTVLSAISRGLGEQKLQGPAREIDEQIEHMRQHIERDLVRARLASGRGRDLTPLKPAIDSIMTTLKRLPKGEDMEWSNLVTPGIDVPVERNDLLELLGNLLDNARKYGTARVEASYDGNCIRIDDDGPGVPVEELNSIRQRGKRLDESRKGFGLGLSIVEDITDIYEIDLRFLQSPLGGLRVELGLKA